MYLLNNNLRMDSKKDNFLGSINKVTVFPLLEAPYLLKTL